MNNALFEKLGKPESDMHSDLDEEAKRTSGRSWSVAWREKRNYHILF